MRLFGFEITRAPQSKAAQLSRVDESRGGWWPIIREPYTTAWQAGQETSADTVLAFAAVYTCVTLIASDIAKCRLKLVEQTSDDIWTETFSPSFSPVLRRPNHYQNRIQFFTWWLMSKLLHGNTYVLKQRDGRGIVTALYILNPGYVFPLVAPDGSVFYELRRDLSGLALAGYPDGFPAIPAREIIHDINGPLFHPLIGVTPIYACGLAAYEGLKIQNASAKFFAQGSQPGGVLTAPGTIHQETADRLKAYWETNFSGDNIGKVAVLGDGLKYEGMAVKAVDAQLIEQLKWTGENVCTAYRVPAYKAGVGAPPSYNNIEALDQQYYSQCLQIHFESIELLLDEGLELPTSSPRYGTEFDLDDLLRMDTASKMKMATEGVGGGVLTVNEARAKFDKRPLPGGNSAYLQQQYFSLEALNRRDQKDPAPATPARPLSNPSPPDESSTRTIMSLIERTVDLVRMASDRLAVPLPAPEPPSTAPGLDASRFQNSLMMRVLRQTLANAMTPAPVAPPVGASLTALPPAEPPVITVPITVQLPEEKKRTKRVERNAQGLILRIVEE